MISLSEVSWSITLRASYLVPNDDSMPYVLLEDAYHRSVHTKYGNDTSPILDGRTNR